MKDNNPITNYNEMQARLYVFMDIAGILSAFCLFAYVNHILNENHLSKILNLAVPMTMPLLCTFIGTQIIRPTALKKITKDACYHFLIAHSSTTCVMTIPYLGIYYDEINRFTNFFFNV